MKAQKGPMLPMISAHQPPRVETREAGIKDERISLNVLDSARKLREGQERMLATMASVWGGFGHGSDSGSAAFAAAPHASQTFSHWFEPVKQALNALPDADQACLANTTLDYASDILSVLQGMTACMPDGLTHSMEEEFTMRTANGTLCFNT